MVSCNTPQKHSNKDEYFSFNSLYICGSEEIRMNRVAIDEPQREKERESVSGEPIKDDEDGKASP